MTEQKLEWPMDAVMVVASRLGTEIRDRMVDPTIVSCRDCDTQLCADLATIRRAASHPHRHNRPVDFFCVECAVKYDPKSIAITIDDRVSP